jgi:hypothetical protein
MLDERDENHNAERYLSLLLFTGHQQAVERGRASHQRLVPAHGVSSWPGEGRGRRRGHPVGKHSVQAGTCPFVLLQPPVQQ